MSQGMLEPAAVMRWVPGLFDALHEMHAYGCVHRDISPANIVIDGTGKATIVDFGALMNLKNRDDYTTMGTPGYAAPEQLTDMNSIGLWTDIFGLSTTLCYIMMGGLCSWINGIDLRRSRSGEGQ